MINMKEISDKNELIELYQSEEIMERYEENRFHSFFGILSNLLEREIFANILKNNINNNIILEVATGTGRITRNIHVPYLGIAIDTSLGMLKVAKSKSNSENWHFVQANGFKLPLVDNSVNLIITFRFLRHLTNIERIQILNEFNRVLTNDGILIFDMLNPERPLLGRVLEKVWIKFIFVYNLIVKRNIMTSKVYDDNENKNTVINELRKAGFSIEYTYNVGNYYSIEIILDYLTLIPILSRLTRRIVNPLVYRFYKKEISKLYEDESNPWEFIFHCRKGKNE